MHSPATAMHPTAAVATASALRQNGYRWQKAEDENYSKSTHKDAPFYRDSNAA